MYPKLYRAFLESGDTLRVYRKEGMIFSSVKDRLLPLMDYIKHFGRGKEPVTIFDKIMGNAAALLAARVNCNTVYSPLGSEIGIKSLEEYSIAYHLDKVVPYIMRPDGKDMCPMEKLSIDKTPDEFYRELKARIEGNKG